MAASNQKPVPPAVVPSTQRPDSEVITSRTKQRRSLLISGVVLVALLVLLIAWPGDLLSKLTFLNSGVCPQRPSHSYFIDGQKMPLEARMIGIFAGFLLTVLALWFVGRGRALRWPRLPVSLLLVALVMVMVVDGLNSTALDLGWPTLYRPENWLRVLTGAISGAGMAGLVMPVFNLTIWKRGYLLPTFKNWREVLYALIPVVLLALGVISGWGPLFWPISLLAVAGVQVMLGIFNMIIAAIVIRRENRVESASGLLLPATLILLVSLGEMLLLAAFRQAFAGATVIF
ncbi:MAG TPA: DUF2085 domain-containing protein [Chloroflexia bacterium]|nr:DUF2085 domain-containing protein [Chloroflexia bacterium]